MLRLSLYLALLLTPIPKQNVFTKNSRSVLPITLVDGSVVYVVAIGAMLVGSINWSEGVAAGKEVKKGDELSCFSLFYGRNASG